MRERQSERCSTYAKLNEKRRENVKFRTTTDKRRRQRKVTKPRKSRATPVRVKHTKKSQI